MQLIWSSTFKLLARWTYKFLGAYRRFLGFTLSYGLTSHCLGHRTKTSMQSMRHAEIISGYHWLLTDQQISAVRVRPPIFSYSLCFTEGVGVFEWNSLISMKINLKISKIFCVLAPGSTPPPTSALALPHLHTPVSEQTTKHTQFNSINPPHSHLTPTSAPWHPLCFPPQSLASPSPPPSTYSHSLFFCMNLAPPLIIPVWSVPLHIERCQFSLTFVFFPCKFVTLLLYLYY